MIRSTPLACVLLAVATAAASADWPTTYSMSGDDGARGSLVVEAAGKTLVRGRAKVKVTLKTTGGDGDRVLSGTLKNVGDVFVGELRSQQGLGGHLQTLRILPPYQVELTQGLTVRLKLTRNFETVKFVGRSKLGNRSEANEATIRRFYTAFQNKDAAGMAAEYAENVHFSDRVFPNLHGSEAGSMWAMLCENESLTLRFEDVSADGRHGKARWIADYVVFGNKVNNIIDANFEFDDAGKIVRHVDQFDFNRWAKQALPKPVTWLPNGPVLGTIRAALTYQLYQFRKGQTAAKSTPKVIDAPLGVGAR